MRAGTAVAASSEVPLLRGSQEPGLDLDVDDADDKSGRCHVFRKRKKKQLRQSALGIEDVEQEHATGTSTR